MADKKKNQKKTKVWKEIEEKPKDKIVSKKFRGPSIFERIGRVMPRGKGEGMKQLAGVSGVSRSYEELVGLIIIYWLFFSLMVVGLGYLMKSETYILAIIIIGSLGVLWVLAFTILSFLADRRAEEVEQTLPDVLQIVSANISAGMTPYSALWISARKEFGVIAQEIKVAQKETLAGKEFRQALSEMGARVRSKALARTIRLIIQGMKSGGELPTILTGIAADIRRMKLLEKEMAANTTTYTMFIIFGMLIGAPLLFSVSIEFVETINKFQPEISTEDIPSTPMAAGGLSGFSMMTGSRCPKDFDEDGIPDACEKKMGLDPRDPADAGMVDPKSYDGETYYEVWSRSGTCEAPAACVTSSYLETFALLALFTISFFGSLLIGLIRHGKQSAGIKYMPILVIATLMIFFLFRLGLQVMFGTIFA